MQKHPQHYKVNKRVVIQGQSAGAKPVTTVVTAYSN